MSDPEMPPADRVAVYDFDRTIATRDALVPFIVRICGPCAVLMALLIEHRTSLGFALGRIARDEFKAVLFRRLLLGMDAAYVQEQGEDYARVVLEKRMRPKMLERIELHRRLGHRQIIVSASLDTYLNHVGAALGFDDVVATRLEVDAKTGKLTGEMVGGNVRGPAKVEHVEKLLGRRPHEVWAYGDSEGDAELLAWADHAHWVHGRFRQMIH